MLQLPFKSEWLPTPMFQYFRQGIRKLKRRGVRVAQSVKHSTLGFGSRHGPMVCGIETCVGLCADSMEPSWGSLSPFLSTPPLLTLSLDK